MPPVSFKNDIAPLFTQVDIEHMEGYGVSLDSYEYMSVPDNAQASYQEIAAKRMPPSRGGGAGPWPDDKIALFKAWMDGGYQP